MQRQKIKINSTYQAFNIVGIFAVFNIASVDNFIPFLLFLVIGGVGVYLLPFSNQRLTASCTKFDSF